MQRKDSLYLVDKKQLFLGSGPEHKEITLEIRAYKTFPAGSAINGFTDTFYTVCGLIFIVPI